jgi:hypothetical protein
MFLKWVVQNGGFVTTVVESRDSPGPREVSIPAWQRLFGDEAIAHVVIPINATEAEWVRGRQLFPEAQWWGGAARAKRERERERNGDDGAEQQR